MHRHATVALTLFLAAGCEHSGSLEAPPTPGAAEPAPAEPAPSEPAPSEPAPAPGASASRDVVPPELLRPNRAFAGGARWSPGWGGERPRMKLQGGSLAVPLQPLAPATSDPATAAPAKAAVAPVKPAPAKARVAPVKPAPTRLAPTRLAPAKDVSATPDGASK